MLTKLWLYIFFKPISTHLAITSLICAGEFSLLIVYLRHVSITPKCTLTYHMSNSYCDQHYRKEKLNVCILHAVSQGSPLPICTANAFQATVLSTMPKLSGSNTFIYCQFTRNSFCFLKTLIPQSLYLWNLEAAIYFLLFFLLKSNTADERLFS